MNEKVHLHFEILWLESLIDIELPALSKCISVTWRWVYTGDFGCSNRKYQDHSLVSSQNSAAFYIFCRCRATLLRIIWGCLQIKTALRCWIGVLPFRWAGFIVHRSSNARCDESAYVQSVLRARQIDGYFVEPSPENLLNIHRKLIWHQDEPFGSTSIFAQWCVFQKAKEMGLTVMLDGQGADELLAGYHTFFAPMFASLFTKFQWNGDV